MAALPARSRDKSWAAGWAWPQGDSSQMLDLAKGDAGHCAVPSTWMGIEEWTPHPVPETQIELSSASLSPDLPGPRE